MCGPWLEEKPILSYIVKYIRKQKLCPAIESFYILTQKIGLFFTRQFFLYIKLNKGEIIMNYDIDDLIFADEEAYVSDR